MESDDILREFVEYIARGLVDNPDQVKVTEDRHGDRVTLYLDVAEADMGKVIGKGGRIAHAIRNLVKVAAIQEDVRANLEIG
jgi:predicted RNA-binding protein YlqC (UPF0109 family)